MEKVEGMLVEEDSCCEDDGGENDNLIIINNNLERDTVELADISFTESIPIIYDDFIQDLFDVHTSTLAKTIERQDIIIEILKGELLEKNSQINILINKNVDNEKHVETMPRKHCA